MPAVHAQSGNEAVLEQWSEQTGEQVQVSRDEAGGVTWSVSASVDAYQRRVEAPADSQELTPYRNGDFHSVTTSGEWQSQKGDGQTSHVFFANTHSSDPAIHSLYRNQITTLQAGFGDASRRAAAGDVVANFSMLGASTGLRGISAQWQGSRHSVEGFSGVVVHSWETLFGTKALPDASDVPLRKRNVHGLKFNTALNEQVTVFATVQTFDDRKLSGMAASVAGDSSYADSLPEPAYNAQSSTLGLSYRRSFGGGQTLDLVMEQGWSRAGNTSQASRTSAQAHNLNLQGSVPWSDGQYSLGLGHHELGMQWTGLGAAAYPGSRESYLTNGLQWDNGFSWLHDWRDGMSRQPWGDDVYEARLMTSTHQIGWQPEWMNGGMLALHDIRTRSSDNADNTSRAHKTQASVSMVSGGWQGSAQSGLSGQDVIAESGERERVRDWQVSVGHSAQDLAQNAFRLSSYSASVFAGRKSHLSRGDGRMVVRSVGFDLSSYSPVWGSLSLSHSRQWVRLAAGGEEVPTRNTTLDYVKELQNGLTFRIYASRLDQNLGLPYAELNEKLVGVQLSKSFQ
ncbi:hypothetical protein [Hydrogenophaga sp. 5NK40-0174]|uniref:hypothetical protein n=1 Tax=Hydrogenophaga sp. 5NK40-0174 TaxID=3127649 RepID=UPI00310B19B3